MARDQISYGEWGEQFFASAISEERLLGAVNDLAGQPIAFGPIPAGPGRIAKVRAYGAIGEARATRIGADGDPIGFRVQLPVDITFELDLSLDVQRFHATLLVPLVLTAQALDGVRIWVDIQPPRGEDVQVDVRGEGVRASFVKWVANIEGELKRFVARYVAKELEKPHIQQARLIDVGAMIDKAWGMLKPPPAPAEGVVADLNDALASEIREREDVFLGETQPEGR